MNPLATVRWLLLPTRLYFSGGGSSGSSSSSSKTVFPKKYLDQFYQYFGRDGNFNYGGPKFDPAYKGFGSFDDVENTAYTSSADKLTKAYNDVIGKQDDDFSRMGLTNSPTKYAEGGARDITNRDYMSSLQQAARDAHSQRLGLEETEAGRETGYNVDKAKALSTLYINLFNSVAGAGKKSSGSSSNSSANFSLFGG